MFTSCTWGVPVLVDPISSSSCNSGAGNLVEEREREGFCSGWVGDTVERDGGISVSGRSVSWSGGAAVECGWRSFSARSVSFTVGASLEYDGGASGSFSWFWFGRRALLLRIDDESPSSPQSPFFSSFPMIASSSPPLTPSLRLILRHQIGAFLHLCRWLYHICRFRLLCRRLTSGLPLFWTHVADDEGLKF